MGRKKKVDRPESVYFHHESQFFSMNCDVDHSKYWVPEEDRRLQMVSMQKRCTCKMRLSFLSKAEAISTIMKEIKELEGLLDRVRTSDLA